MDALCESSLFNHLLPKIKGKKKKTQEDVKNGKYLCPLNSTREIVIALMSHLRGKLCKFQTLILFPVLSHLLPVWWDLCKDFFLLYFRYL